MLGCLGASAVSSAKPQVASARPAKNKIPAPAIEPTELSAPMQTLVRAFLGYPRSAQARIKYLRQRVPSEIYKVLPELEARFDAQVAAVEINEAFVRALVAEAASIPKDYELPEPWEASPREDGWVLGAFHALKREWADEGSRERAQSIGAMLEALEHFVPRPEDDAPKPRILVPGAGLFRQAWECSVRGYVAVGVEQTIMMCAVARFMLTLLTEDRQLPMCPHVHEFHGPTNVYSASHLSRAVHVPGEEALALARADRAAVSRGSMRVVCERLEAHVRKSLGSYDVALTCFYLDASGDVVGAIEDVAAALRPGGIWISCGPLEYDGTSGGHTTGALRLCADEVLLYIQRRGFELLEVRRQTCLYTYDEQSLFGPTFESLFFVARKTARDDDGEH